MYSGRIYEKILGDKALYSGKKLSVPRPEFIVLYNGAAPFPDEAEMKLSDSFEGVHFAGFEGDKPVELELKAKVYNINYGRNEGMVKRSGTLEGYSRFIAKVREYEGSGYELEGAVKAAVRWCTGPDILRYFFESHGTEVVNMLMTEWNWDDAFAVQRAEGREEGLEAAKKEDARNALAKGFTPEIISEITGLDVEAILQLSQP
jgi:hypothetical protein